MPTPPKAGGPVRPEPDAAGAVGLQQAPVIERNLRAALHALEATGQSWLLLRGQDDLARPTGDVDILVASDLLPILDDLLQAEGFRRVLAPGHGSHWFYFCYSATDGSWVKLDIVSEIAFGPYQQWRTSLAPQCLGRRVRRGPLWLPAPADQGWLQLLHLFLDKGQIAPARVDAARKAAEAASAYDFIACFVDHRMGQGTAAEILALVRAGNFNQVPATAASMASRWAGGTAAPRLTAARHKGLRLFGARLQGSGPVVAVMAPDGAGKTTLLRGLQATVPLPIKYLYMGMWGAGPWDAWLVKVPGGRSAKKVYRMLRGGLLERLYSLMGRLVLMDRVPYDALLPGTGAGGILEKMTNTVAFTVVQPPDLLLVLDVPGHVMFSRKGEHSPEILEGWRQAYRKLAGQLPGSTLIDATQGAETVLRQATGIVWNQVSQTAETGPGVDRESGSGAGSPGQEPSGTQGTGSGAIGALTSHLWRRLDWRFLLPDLQVSSVGYGGTTSPELKSALHLIDPAAAAVAPGRADQGSTYGVVLLSNPDLMDFKAAADAVKPGGWMCVEVRRSLFRRSGPRTLKGWKHALIRSGYQDVSAYWNAPSLDRTARIVPVDSAAAIRNTLSLHKDVRFGAAKALAARLALMLHLFDLAIPEGTVTGRRPSAEEPQ
ncbi:hypothetical protein [Pseudarthrobacter sp. NBSH8]|uniref:hypothetical protein n=1 Tax=Pseudarthrobacter sp. NBSH8 TaxID=2596911 RepID=UPI0016258B49|nr:hypothetical protein [Pseudarthrobacter sp. NBSH8]QNE16226.1 hypothetical protein FYJ92_18650 [Pseudarthrobacter sp. NBSH8]